MDENVTVNKLNLAMQGMESSAGPITVRGSYAEKVAAYSTLLLLNRQDAILQRMERLIELLEQRD